MGTRDAIPSQLLSRAEAPALTGYALQEWSLIAAAWALMTYAPAYTYPLFALFIGGRLHALGVIIHDAAHMPEKKTWQMRIVEILAGYATATTIEAMRYHHLRHHRDTNMPTDPYFKSGLSTSYAKVGLMWLRSILLVPFWTIRAPFGVAAYFVPSLRNAYGRAFLQDRRGEDLTHSRAVIRCAREEAGQLAMQALVVSVVPFETLAFFYLVPALVAGLLSGYRLLHEHSFDAITEREHAYSNTRDHTSPLGALLFAPRNVGCHIVHHLHPTVGLHALPALRDWYRTHDRGLYPGT